MIQKTCMRRVRSLWIIGVLLAVMLLAGLSCAVLCAATEDVPGRLPFSDVKVSHPYYDAIAYCYENGIFKGTSETTFAPDDPMTRATVVTVLANTEGMNPAKYAQTSFVDVADNAWYAPYVAWAAQNRVVNGYGSGAFGPEDKITVEQAIQILYNFGGSAAAAVSTLDAFADGAAVSGWASDAMLWALDNGIYAGEDGMLHPTQPASRALMAHLMQTFSRYRQEFGIYADIGYYGSDGDTVIGDVHFTDAMFAPDSHTYHHDIAKFALALVCTAGNPEDEALTADDRTVWMDRALGRFGFGQVRYHRYDKSPSSEEDTVAHAFAQKHLVIDGEDCLLITVICRGSGYSAEWVSNGNVGESGTHHGFAAAADDVYTNLRAYIAETVPDADTKQIKLLISGFSRSAAVANALAGMLNEDAAFDAGNLYTYTFATPNVTDMQDASTNIYNILNAHDLVPLIPMTQFGFCRNGIDVYLPYEESGLTERAYAAFASYFAALTGGETADDCRFDGQYRVVRMLADLIGDWVGSREAYCLHYQAAIQQLFRDGLGGEGTQQAITQILVGAGGASGDSLAALAAYLELFRMYLQYTASDPALQTDASYFMEHVGDLTAHAHRMETYLAWMYTLTAEDWMKTAESASESEPINEIA